MASRVERWISTAHPEQIYEEIVLEQDYIELYRNLMDGISIKLKITCRTLKRALLILVHLNSGQQSRAILNICGRPFSENSKFYSIFNTNNCF